MTRSHCRPPVRTFRGQAASERATSDNTQREAGASDTQPETDDRQQTQTSEREQQGKRQDAAKQKAQTNARKGRQEGAANKYLGSFGNAVPRQAT